MAITYFERPLNHEVYSLESGLAIVQNGDTASVAITGGQYIFLKNHSTLPNGGYHATTNIAVGTTISSSNVAADANGIANALNGAISTINGNLANKVNTSAIANNLTTTAAGSVLDARQGKTLNDGLTGVKTITTGTTTGIRYFRTLNSKLVIVNVGGKTIDTGANAWKTIGTLPSGYRPSYSFYFAVIDDLHSVPYEGRCNTNGVVEFYGSASYASAIPTANFSFLIT